MNKKTLTTLTFCSRFLCILLSFTFLIQSSTVSYAQTGVKKKQIFVKKLEKNLLKEIVAVSDNTRPHHIPSRAFLEQKQATFEAVRNDPDFQQLELIQDFFIPSPFVKRDVPEVTPASFAKDYVTLVRKQAEDALSKAAQGKAKGFLQMEQALAQAQKTGTTIAQVESVRSAYQKEVSAWEATLRREVAQWVKEETAAAPNKYEEFKAEQIPLRAKELDKTVRQLMAMYRRAPGKTKPYLMRLAPHILRFTRANGSRYFTPGEQILLRNMSLKEVQSNEGCLKGDWSCETVILGVTLLGALGNIDDGDALAAFIEKHMKTQAAGTVLTAGVAALLAIKDYSAVWGILAGGVREESAEDFELSLQNGAETIKNWDGKYLGKMSKQASLQDKTGYPANAWEEVAAMLAEEGSRDSLTLLKEFGINRCYVSVTQENHYSFMCNTILPFLVGALASGKSGAENYDPSGFITTSGSIISNGGTGKGTVFVTEKMAQMNLNKKKGMIAALHQFSQKTGMPSAAAFTRSLFLLNPGDLAPFEELRLDNKLVNLFNKQIQGKKIDSRYLIKAYDTNSQQYKDKLSRQNTMRWLVFAAAALDVALLVWMGADVVRMGIRGVGLLKGISALRAGTSVFGNARMLMQLRVAKPLLAWKNFKPSLTYKIGGLVESQMPLFTSSRVVRLAPSAEAVSLGNMVSSVRFSAETGKLSIDAKNLYTNHQATPLEIKNFKQILSQVTKQTEDAFMKKNSSWYNRFVGEDHLYRKLLANEIRAVVPASGGRASSYIQTPQMKATGQLLDFVAADRSIGVSQTFKNSISLFGTNGKAGEGSIAAVHYWLNTMNMPLVNAKELTSLLSSAYKEAGVAYAKRSGFLTGNSLTRFLHIDRVPWRGDAYFRGLLSKKVGIAIEQSNALPIEQKLELINKFNFAITRDISIKQPVHLESFTLAKGNGGVPYESRQASVLHKDQRETYLPLNLKMDARIDGVSGLDYQRVVFKAKEDGAYMLQWNSHSLGGALDMKNFKITVPQSDIILVAQAAQESGIALKLKLIAYENPGWWYRTKKAFGFGGDEFLAGVDHLKDPALFSSRMAHAGEKGKVFSEFLPVLKRTSNGALEEVPLTINADHFLGLKQGSRLVLEPKGKVGFLSPTGESIYLDKPFYFGLPKEQSAAFVQAVSKSSLGGGAGAGSWYKAHTEFNAMPNPTSDKRKITLIFRNNKTNLWRMYVATGLSLSSASTGLLSPLETYYPSTYPDGSLNPNGASDLQKMAITLGLPFIPSLFAPALTPFVKRFGALNITKTSLLISGVGLGIASANGFAWHINKDNPPPLWPLFVSATSIGVASALSRASLNTLIGKVSGSKGLVTSMLAKNIGSVSLLLPPLVFGAFYSKDKGNLSNAPDFSSSMPVLTGMSLGAWTILQFSAINRSIGKVGSFRFSPKSVLLDIGSSYKAIGSSALLLPMGAAAFLTGFEAAAYNKAANQMIKPEIDGWVKNWSVSSSIDGTFKLSQSHQQKNMTSLVVGFALLPAPFLARWKAGPLLEALGKTEDVRYANMLRLSLVASAAGGAMLLNNDSNSLPLTMGGVALLGLGTANVFQSLQNLATLRYLRTPTALADFKAAGADLNLLNKTKDLYKNTSRTIFSTANTGMALAPMVVAPGMDYLSAPREEGPVIQKSEIPHYSLLSSYAFFTAGGVLALKSMGKTSIGLKSLWPAFNVVRKMYSPVVGVSYINKALHPTGFGLQGPLLPVTPMGAINPLPVVKEENSVPVVQTPQMPVVDTQKTTATPSL